MGRHLGVLIFRGMRFRGAAMILCGAATVLADIAKVKIVSPDSLEPYRQFMLSAREDTLANCDTASPVPSLIRAHLGSHSLSVGRIEKGDSAWDGFRSRDFPVARFTFLKLVGDSLYAIGTLDKNPEPETYFPICLDKKKLLAVYRVEEDANKWAKGSHGGRGSNGRSGVGLFVSGTLLALLLILLVLSS